MYIVNQGIFKDLRVFTKTNNKKDPGMKVAFHKFATKLILKLVFVFFIACMYVCMYVCMPFYVVYYHNNLMKAHHYHKSHQIPSDSLEKMNIIILVFK